MLALPYLVFFLSFLFSSLAAPIEQVAADLAALDGRPDDEEKPYCKVKDGCDRNDLEFNTACRNVSVIYSRGTVGFGNFGDDTGPVFFHELEKRLGKTALSFQGIAFPEQPSETRLVDGSSKMRELVERTAARCPQTHIVLGCKGIGCQLVHATAARLDAQYARNITAVVLFSDLAKKWIGADTDDFWQIKKHNIAKFCFPTDHLCAGIAPPSIPTSWDAIPSFIFQPFNGLWGLLARTQYGLLYGSVAADFLEAKLQGRTLTSWELMPAVARKIKDALTIMFNEGKGDGEESHYKSKKEQAKGRWNSMKEGWRYLFGGLSD
ncbi:hypothetical protein MBLNU457_5495t2 [Dothideomycetes sp. NU457]